MLPEPAARTADSQRGVLARFQLLPHYPKPHHVDSILRGDRFAPIDPRVRGVHRVRGSGSLPEQYAFAAALRARPRATITGPLVLGLLGVPGFTTASPFEVLVMEGRRLRGVEFSHRVDPEPDRPVITYGDVRVAAPLDGLIDSAAFVDDLGERRLRVAWDHLRWEGIARTEKLHQRLEELRGVVPGAAVLEGILGRSGGVEVESEGERALVPVVDCFEPPPERQVWVTPGRRVDFLFRPLRLALEYLGKVDHGTVDQRLADDRRDDELRQAGIRTHYVTARDLDDPAQCLAQLAGVLVIRAHDLGVPPPVPVRPLTA